MKLSQSKLLKGLVLYNYSTTQSDTSGQAFHLPKAKSYNPDNVPEVIIVLVGVWI